ncbi:MAG: DUF2993 domain-containing protein [Phormidesmis sp.]
MDEEVTEFASDRPDRSFDAHKSGDSSGSSGIVGRILPAAVRLWLRSQVEQVEALSLRLEGRDRQILSGYLPGICISAEQAIYKGLHIGQLQLSANDIRINVGQVIRGKPLRLLKGFPVLGEVGLTADDLNASCSSALLATGLQDFWRSLVREEAIAEAVNARYGPLSLHPELTLHDPRIRLADQRIGLSFYPCAQGDTADGPVILGTGLSVLSGHQLQLTSPRWLDHLESIGDERQGQPVAALDGFQWNLGRDTQLTQLALTPDQLLCRGQIAVNP